MFCSERNALVHLAVTVAVVVAGFIFGLSPLEWMAVVVCIGVVLAAEAFNSAIEKLADHTCMEQNPNIRDTKDLAAGAVLLAAIASVGVGMIIFLPKIYHLFA